MPNPITPEQSQVRLEAERIGLMTAFEIPHYNGTSSPFVASKDHAGDCIAFALRSASTAFEQGIRKVGIIVVCNEMVASSHAMAAVGNETGDLAIIDNRTKKNETTQLIDQSARISDPHDVHESFFGGINAALQLAATSPVDGESCLDATGMDDWSHYNKGQGRHTELLVSGFFGRHAKLILKACETGEENSVYLRFKSLFSRYKSSKRVEW